MKCPCCNGDGRTQYFDYPRIRCGGTGEIEVTNEEWFCQLSTEEKAEFLVKIEMSAMHPVKRGAVNMEKFIEEVVEWLKEKHKE